MNEHTLEFKWTVSRGRDTYGYNICSLYVDGRKVSSCNGGGYDMEGTALGSWIAKRFKDELLKLKIPMNRRNGEDVQEYYGLSFHDPNFDPGKAIIGKDCTDRTFSGKSEGKTVEQAEKDGDTAGLERYQAFYAASPRVPTERHIIPLIDGACGKSSVEKIINAIGYQLVYVNVRSKNLTVYRMVEMEKEEEAV